MLKNKANILIWLISSTLAFIAGLSLAPNSPNQLTIKSSLSADNEIDAHTTSTYSQNSLLPDSNRVQNQKQLTPIQTNKIDQALAHFQSLNHSNFLLDLNDIGQAYLQLKQLNQAQVYQLMYQLKDTLNKPNSWLALTMVLGRYGELAPIDAIAFVSDHLNSTDARISGLGQVLTSWAKTSPNEAIDWYNNNKGYINSLSTRAGEGFGSSIIFGALAQQDFNNAIDQLNIYASDGGNLPMAVRGISQSITNSDDYHQLIEHVELINNPQLVKTIASTWAMKNPQQLSEQLDKINFPTEEAKAEINEQILTSWSSTEPTKAADWYLNQQPEEKHQQAVNRVAKNLAFVNPEHAMNWLSARQELDTSNAFYEILSVSTFSETNFAIDNLEKLTSEQQKQALSLQIYQTLLESNRDRAENFLAFSPYKFYIEQNLN